MEIPITDKGVMIVIKSPSSEMNNPVKVFESSIDNIFLELNTRF